MSTDPMRNALERAIDILTRIRDDDWDETGVVRYNGRYVDQSMMAGEALDEIVPLAREALAAHPDDQHVRVSRADLLLAISTPFAHERTAEGQRERHAIYAARVRIRAALAAHQPPGETA